MVIGIVVNVMEQEQRAAEDAEREHEIVELHHLRAEMVEIKQLLMESKSKV